MEFETIRYEVEDRIATITFNRPDKLNAISPLMVRELAAAYSAVESDEAVWIAIVTDDDIKANCRVLRFRDTMWLQLLANIAWDGAKVLGP